MSTVALNNNFSSVDPGIMARNDDIDEKKRAAELREQRMIARRGQENKAVEEEREMSLREQVMMAKKDQRVRVEQEKKKEEKTINPMQRGTGALLRSAWLVLIPSFGLSLIWINIHALMRMIPGFSSVFCKIGDEWIPKDVQGVAGDLNKGVGVVEKGGIFFFDFLVMLVILIFIAIVMLVIDLVNKLGWFFTIFT